MTRLLRRLLDRLSLYLPLILMGLLALGTYWLVRSTPVFDAPGADRPKTHEPDYFMRTFSVKTFDASGRLRSEIYGSQAQHYPDTDTLEIEHVRIRSFNDKGQLTTATAQRAIANRDVSEVQLVGDALVVRDAVRLKNGEMAPRLSFRGEFLHAFLDTERLKSHLPVELMRGPDRFTANAMAFDNYEQVLELHGRVRGVLQPPPTAR